MQLFRRLIVPLCLVCVVGGIATTSAAAALPTLLYLAGETGEALATGLITGVLGTVRLETELESLPGTGVRLELTGLKNDTKLGTYLANFFGVEENTGAKATCNSTGFGVGEVHFSGEWHLVYVGLSPATTLIVGLLLLVPKQSVKCGPEKTVSFEGSLLAKLTKLGASDFTEFGVVLKCASIVKPELTEYDNEAGTKVKAAFKFKLGGLSEPACLNWSSEMTLKFNKMLTIDL